MEKLLENQHKTGFENVSVAEGFFLLRDEVNELDVEIFAPGKPCDYEKVRREAADVANFASMIILRCVQEMEKRK